MKKIEIMLFGIGLLLFAICMYLFGTSLQSSSSMFIGLFSQIAGISIICYGFFEKKKWL